VQNVIPLEVRGRWYERGWVRTALVLLGAALVYLLVRLRTRYLLARADRLAQLVRERTHELQAANERLNRLASVDELTGLLNRRELMRQLELAHETAQRTGAPLSILMLDLDAFKALNDTHGHQAGDAVLVQLAARLAAAAPEGAVVCRYGGEEFAVLAPGMGLDEARALGEHLRAAIAATPIALDGLPDAPPSLDVTVSVGVGILSPDQPVSPADLLRAADEAVSRVIEVDDFAPEELSPPARRNAP